MSQRTFQYGDVVLHLDPAAPAETRTRTDAEAITFISERMKLCPVSRNLTATVQKAIGLRLAA